MFYIFVGSLLGESSIVVVGKNVSLNVLGLFTPPYSIKI